MHNQVCGLAVLWKSYKRDPRFFFFFLKISLYDTYVSDVTIAKSGKIWIVQGVHADSCPAP